MMDYCPYCRKRTEHIKDEDEKLCKRCGKKTKKIDPFKLIAGHN